jgi:hypothetical protein
MAGAIGSPAQVEEIALHVLLQKVGMATHLGQDRVVQPLQRHARPLARVPAAGVVRSELGHPCHDRLKAAVEIGKITGVVAKADRLVGGAGEVVGHVPGYPQPAEGLDRLAMQAGDSRTTWRELEQGIGHGNDRTQQSKPPGTLGSRALIVSRQKY